MYTITRLTTKYNTGEDRLQLNVDLDAGPQSILWLTQRLANALFSTLAARLDQAVAASAHWERETHLEWEHQAARGSQTPQEPVEPVEARSLLVHTIDLQQHDNLFRLVLKASPDFAAVLDFDQTQLHQWLGIAHRLYREAGWPESIWPRWMTESGTSGDTGSPQVVH